jgi:multidrug resistance efflux pump
MWKSKPENSMLEFTKQARDRFFPSALLVLTLVLTASGRPIVGASSPAAAGTVTASAVVVPARAAQMGFVISATVKAVNVKAGDKVSAGQPLIVLDTPDLEFAVVGAEAAVRSAQANAELQRVARKTVNPAGRIVYLSGPPELRQVADAQLQQAQAALEVAQASLAQGTLSAPYNGTVVAVNVAPGELVQAHQVVVTFADLDHMQIETTDLSEREIVNVQIGQKAIVRLKAFAQDLSGSVTAVAPKGEKSGGDVVYKVTIELDSPPAGLLWGMSGDVEIQTK